jgi:hypothetical protein
VATSAAAISFISIRLAFVFLKGYKVPAGTEIIIPLYVIHRYAYLQPVERQRSQLHHIHALPFTPFLFPHEPGTMVKWMVANEIGGNRRKISTLAVSTM